MTRASITRSNRIAKAQLDARRYGETSGGSWVSIQAAGAMIAR